MSSPKIFSVGRKVRSEMAFAYTGGVREILMLNAKLIFDRALKSIGQNAKGSFKIDFTFYPDSLTDKAGER